MNCLGCGKSIEAGEGVVAEFHHYHDVDWSQSGFTGGIWHRLCVDLPDEEPE